MMRRIGRAELLAAATLLLAASTAAEVAAAPLGIGGIYGERPPFRTATPCVNGYRLIHVVPSRGRAQGGVLIRCRGR